MPPPAPNDWEVTKALVLSGAQLAATPRVSVLAAERLRHQRWGPGLKESPRSVFPGMAADHRLHDGLGSFFKVQIPGPSPHALTVQLWWWAQGETAFPTSPLVALKHPQA